MEKKTRDNLVIGEKKPVTHWVIEKQNPSTFGDG